MLQNIGSLQKSSVRVLSVPRKAVVFTLRLSISTVSEVLSGDRGLGTDRLGELGVGDEVTGDQSYNK